MGWVVAFWSYAAFSTLLALGMLLHCRECRRLSIGSMTMKAALGIGVWGLFQSMPMVLVVEPWPCVLLICLFFLAMFQVCVTLELFGHWIDRMLATSHGANDPSGLASTTAYPSRSRSQHSQ